MHLSHAIHIHLDALHLDRLLNFRVAIADYELRRQEDQQLFAYASDVLS